MGLKSWGGGGGGGLSGQGGTIPFFRKFDFFLYLS